MEKLAENLQRLTEDDLLQVVQMIHDNKSPDSYTKNDVERRTSTISDICKTLMYIQKVNFTWTFIRCPTPWSSSFGNSRRKSCNERQSLSTSVQWSRS